MYGSDVFCIGGAWGGFFFSNEQKERRVKNVYIWNMNG